MKEPGLQKRIVIGVADMRVSNDCDAVLITYSLGSCIGVSIYDPDANVGGMLHFMLPDSKIQSDKAKLNPYMFADTGIPLLFREAYKLGAQKERTTVKIAGGAQVIDASAFFNIGKRNYAALRKVFWNNGVLISGEDIGGHINRTMRLEIGTGKVFLKTAGNQERLL